MFWKRLRLTLEMIKFEHSVFALPFALTGALLASFSQTVIRPSTQLAACNVLPSTQVDS